VQQVGVKCYVCNVVAWKMYNIKCQGMFVPVPARPKA